MTNRALIFERAQIAWSQFWPKFKTRLSLFVKAAELGINKKPLNSGFLIKRCIGSPNKGPNAAQLVVKLSHILKRGAVGIEIIHIGRRIAVTQ